MNNKNLSTLAVWGPYFSISLSVMVTSFTETSSVILNFGVDGDYAQRISVQRDTLQIYSPVSKTSYSLFEYKIEKDRWYQIQILQDQKNEKVS